MSKNIQCILFDLDGTLVDSAPDLANAVNATLSALGRPTFSQNSIRNWVGNGAKTLIERALCGQAEISDKLDPALARDALSVFLEHYKTHLCIDSVLYPGVKDTLEQLSQKGFVLGLVTNKPAAFISPLLEGLNIAEYFSCQIGGDSLANKKPHPEPLTTAIAQLNQTIENTLMVGDSRNDILAAQAAGVKSVAVTYGYNYGQDIRKNNPDYVFDHFSEILKILDLAR